MVDPFLIEPPAILNVSGGLTSAYNLRRVLDAHDGSLPDGVHAVFANTGRERHATLDFVAEVASRWDVPIRWIERDRTAHGGFREVSHETAARDGEPFAALIEERRFLPNAVARFCTQELKIKPAAAFMRAQGFAHWTSAVGLRFDEPKRVATLRARDHGEWDVTCPLYDARVTKADVAAFWKAQPFGLKLKPHEGNCDLCFLKGRRVRVAIMEDAPDLVAWWAAQESKVGGRFHAHEPGYARTLEAVQRQYRLNLITDDHDEAEGGSALPCACSDRRLWRCNCGKRRGMGRGHALSCAMMFGGRAAA